MKIWTMIRAAEWWDYKFPPILAALYYILYLSPSASLRTAIFLFVFLVISLSVGAAYVSLLNDATDVNDDTRAGKINRLARYPHLIRILVVCIPLVAATVCCWFIPDRQALLFYTLSYLSFTLYSLPQFRLKTKGLAGIIADAAGSQLFPTLYAASLAAYWMEYALSGYQLAFLGLWSFCLGLRGILWHQFHDLENDARIGLRTWVQSLGNQEATLLGRIITFVEISSLMILLLHSGLYAGLAGMSIYFLYLWWRRRKTSVQIILLRYTSPHFTIFLYEYYQVFLPFTILAVLAFTTPSYLGLIALHTIIFPMSLYKVLKNLFTR